MRALHFALLTIACIPSEALAQTSPAAPPPPPPCTTEEYRQLDFWVGEWTATWDNANGTKGTGKNRITKDEYGSCVITEHFAADDGSLKGHSVSTYFKSAGEWRQTWVDNQGGYFDLFGGPKQDPASKFGLETYRRSQQAPFRRMLWQDVKSDSFTWRWQGKAKVEEEWKDQWVIHYSRAKKQAASQ